MRRARVAAAVGIVAALVVATSAPGGEPGLKKGDKAADFTVKMAVRGTAAVKLAELHGKYVLLVFMRKDCDACKQDIPTMNDGYKRLGGEKFTVDVVRPAIGKIRLRDNDTSDTDPRVALDLVNINKGNKQLAHGITQVLRPADL